jgi:signal transduction histidine kinase
MVETLPRTVARDTPVEGEAEGLRRDLRELSEALRSVEAMTGTDIDPAGDPVALCQVLIGEVPEAAEMRRLGIYLMDPADLQFHLAHAVPSEAAELISAEFEAQLTAGEVGRAVRERRPVPALPLAASDNLAPVRSVVLFPISTPRNIWGLALALSRRDCEELPRNSLRLLTIVANYLGAVVENACLMRARAEQNHNLEAIVQQRSADLLAKSCALEEANERLRRMDAAKDDFVSLLAHELRTPLTSILSLSEFLTEEGLSAAEVRDFARSIHSEADRMRGLADDVLDLARMQAGKLIYRYRVEDLNALATQCVESIRPQAQPRGITVRVEPDPGLPAVRMAPERVRQVVLNILSNALKFSPDGSEVLVTTSQTPENVCLRVRDHGLGIAARDLPRVFNRFEQIERIDHHSKGAGCGMAIARSIVEEGHRGKMWVESEGRGKGSTFYFALPKTTVHSEERGTPHG